jgi:hypothetical protein
MKWSDPEPLAALRKLAGRGWPASDIGLELGVTKNAIIGAARRTARHRGIRPTARP